MEPSGYTASSFLGQIHFLEPQLLHDAQMGGWGALGCCRVGRGALLTICGFSGGGGGVLLLPG